MPTKILIFIYSSVHSWFQVAAQQSTQAITQTELKDKSRSLKPQSQCEERNENYTNGRNEEWWWHRMTAGAASWTGKCFSEECSVKIYAVSVITSSPGWMEAFTFVLVPNSCQMTASLGRFSLCILGGWFIFWDWWLTSFLLSSGCWGMSGTISSTCSCKTHLYYKHTVYFWNLCQSNWQQSRKSQGQIR